MTNLFLGPPIFVVRLHVLIVRELRFPVATWPLWAAECMFWGYVQLLSLIVSVSILLTIKPWASWRKTHTYTTFLQGLLLLISFLFMFSIWMWCLISRHMIAYYCVHNTPLVSFGHSEYLLLCTYYKQYDSDVRLTLSNLILPLSFLQMYHCGLFLMYMYLYRAISESQNFNIYNFKIVSLCVKMNPFNHLFIYTCSQNSNNVITG